ncbi:aminotransferase class I/II-fold pyridoxal phosphate-dependent enzyme [Aliikangiella maris]|uniref:Aminotransferase class I/II-fold pyridoxal phosphate-dependent enzyme n=2 Tax=Aliikangiella maris TaxID=3162458 RepID=A0ABV3MUR5_9GAMM
MRDFELETYFSRWEFNAKYNLAASDAESLSIASLLSMAGDDAEQALMSQWLGYTETWGAPQLREKIALTYHSLSQQNILCFHGAEEGIYTAMRVLLRPGDHAIVIVPNYQAAETIPLEVANVTGVALDAEQNWALDLNQVADAIQPNTRLISINFPNNPTGHIISRDTLDQLVSLCRENEIFLFSDEVYRLLELDDTKRLPQVADIYELGFSLNVMSKAYGLPGLRIGWIASQQFDWLQKMERYKHYLSICNSAPSEVLADIALTHADKILQQNRHIIRENLLILDAFFKQYEQWFEWQMPDGGCIAFPKYLGSDGADSFCESLVKQKSVLLLPGKVYRSDLLTTPTSHFRIGFGRKNLPQALDLLTQFIDAK